MDGENPAAPKRARRVGEGAGVLVGDRYFEEGFGDDRSGGREDVERC